MLLVLDDDNRLQGLITANDILMNMRSNTYRTQPGKREEVRYRRHHASGDQRSLRSLSPDVFRAASAIWSTFIERVGLQHALVSTVEYANRKSAAFSRQPEIARQLGLELDPMAHARSFA